MEKDLEYIQSTLKGILTSQIPPLKISKDNTGVFELTGTFPTMQGKQKVDGYYFGSVVPKPKDIRLYFFPIYTHAEAFENISADVRKCLKGKSCFHIKKLTSEMEQDIAEMISLGVELYKKDGLI